MARRFEMPRPDQGRIVVGPLPFNMGTGEVRAPGADVPEAFSWPVRRIEAFLGTRKLLWIPYLRGEVAFVRKVLERLPAKDIKELAKEASIDPNGAREALIEALLAKHGFADPRMPSALKGASGLAWTAGAAT